MHAEANEIAKGVSKTKIQVCKLYLKTNLNRKIRSASFPMCQSNKRSEGHGNKVEEVRKRELLKKIKAKGDQV